MQASSAHKEERGMTSASTSPYQRLVFSALRMMRFTSESDTRNVRAMVAGFSPAANDARMRFALPSGISTTFGTASTGDGTGPDPSPVLALRLRRLDSAD